MNKNLWIGVVVVIVAVLLVVGLSGPSTEEGAMVSQGDQMMTDEVMGGDDNMMVKPSGDTMMDDGMDDDAMMVYDDLVVLAGAEGPAKLYEFDSAAYSRAQEEGKLIALYFYANWCPTCKKEFPVMQAAFEQLTNDDVVGFRVNYNDDETSSDEKELARKHGVGYQHTKVFVKDGVRILKSPESWDQARYVSEINKAL
ncbi:MAG: hypothetical protein COU11_00905 [Candidatus Harrisonbacteria bacterium CG10_big_fil_rev_8_21_14_0_10_49_15]|uniref:Thioredoxin domain-containing protein n=1 Tax=Candidatus Harrisonbacteria bacterium CG10_big_fil_rev_8_21_14_0_10_49_15 TaxID=1974587 RepID=A0A2H0UNG5_9BACT|nr:MAG: hypothetical protein COU11_00905 [Candidatus Harrisonbacteria bacterium CG10_big_fil_rev_8_21_14_0_10_49_15]